MTILGMMILKRFSRAAFTTGVIILLFTFMTRGQTPSLEWARTFPSVGSPNVIYPTAMATDGLGNVYTTGTFRNTRDFDPGPGTFNLTSTGGSNIFISKLDASGGFLWAAQIGGVAGNSTNGIAIDNSGNVYTTGAYVNASADFDPGPGVANLPGNGGYVCKLNSSGGFVWVRRIGPPGPYGISVDAFGDVVTTGIFSGTGDFDPGTGVVNLTSSGVSDIFVSKLNALGDLVWVKKMGGALGESANAITTDILGNVYTTGSFAGTADFDPNAGTVNLTSGGLDDIFISKLSPSGVFVWVKRIGGTGYDRSESIALDGSGNVLTTGSFANTVDFDPGAPVFNITSSGSTDVFISKLDQAGNFIWAKTIGGGSYSLDIAADGTGNVFTTGYFDTIVDFDPGAAVFNVTPFMSPEAYVSKLDANGNFGWVVVPRGLLPGYESEGITLTLDPSGFVIASGWYEGPVDFDPGVCDEILTATSDDTYIWKLDPSTPPATACNPTITGFSPASGPIGTAVTLVGTKFNTTAANNIVYFGATRATVTAATSTQLTVTVPLGATYQPITVTSNGLTAYSPSPFVVTFPDGGDITSCSFTAKTDFTTDAGSYTTAMGDLDADGKTDLVVSNLAGNSVSILRNTSVTGSIDATSFAPAVILDLTPNTGAFGVAIADLDSDGKQDIVVSNYTSDNISIYRNISTPGTITSASFAAKIDFATDVGPYTVAIGDLDMDGKPDIAVTAYNGGNAVSILKNTSTPGIIDAGSFAPRFDINTGFYPYGLAIGDLDADGKPELAVTNFISSSVSLYRNTSTMGVINGSTFGAAVNYPVGTSPLSVAIGDLDSDGKPEVTVANYSSNNLSVLKNATTSGVFTPGSFTFVGNFLTGPNPENVTISDLDGDGSPDLATGNQFGPSVSILKNTSTGVISFAPFVEFAALFNTRIAAVGDLDGDGKPDIAVASAGIGSISILRNTVSSLPPPTITNFSPSSGLIGSTVIITGTNFSAASLLNNTVKFNGVTATVLDATATTITTQVPIGATTGTIKVTVGCNTATSGGNFTASCLPLTERDALIELYNATDGANWTTNTNWLSAADVSTWFGVSVTGCNVTGINLEGNNLNGTIPPQLIDLTMLESLHLGTNNLSGLIPPEIGSLSNLQYLNVAFNSLSGNIPIELENYLQLTDAYLNNNAFTGDAPNIGSSSMNMNTLELQFNQLDYAPTTDLYYNIQNVDVSNNRLTFDDLEPSFYAPISSFIYSPQARVPPGGLISFLPGNDINITFSTGGSSNSYQWYKGAILIPGATATDYLKTGAAAGDVGTYTVQITSTLFPGLTLESLDYTVILDPCPPGPRTSGDLDTSFAPLISAPSFFQGVGTQSDGKIIVGTDYTIVNSIVTSGLVRFNPDGSQDLTFPSNSYGPFLIIQPDNKILAASGPGNLVRLLADGTSDPSFTPSSYVNATIFAVALQPDGKIVVSLDENGTIFLDRLNANGTDDPTFSASVTERCPSIQVQTDGKILVATDFGRVFRLSTTGAIDPAFNTTGVTDLPAAINYISDMAIQPDGKIIAVGLYGYFNDLPHRGIVRLLPDGSIDNSFTAFGISAPLTSGEFFYRVTLQPDGKILLAGFFNTINGTNRKNIARLNVDGTVDCSFDPLVSADDGIYFMSLQANGKIIIIGGFTTYEGTQRYGLARINNIAGGANINITLNTFDAIVCDGDIGTFAVAANGTTNITYQWQRGNDQAASLQGLRWSIPAISSAGADVDNVANPPDVSATMGGTPGTTYAVSLRFRGVAEAKTYVGGITTGFWNVGGTPLAEGYNVYQLDVSDPPATYYLNAGTSGITYTYLLDYVQTVNIKAGATVILRAIAGDNLQIKNRDNLGNPMVVPGIPPAPFPFDGQFIQMDVVAINGGLFSDLSDGGGYSGTTTPTLSINTAGTFGSGRYRCRINGDLAAEVLSFDEGLFINPIPAAPATTGNSACGSSAILLTATGGAPGDFRWYTVATGGTAIPAEVNGTYTTPVLAATTTYYVSIKNGSCESTRIPVAATINTVNKPILVTTNCTTTQATLFGPTGFTSYAWSNGATTQQITVTAAGSYTLIVTSSGCSSPPSDPIVFTSTFCNQAPSITAASVTTTIQSTVTIDLTALTSDLDNNIDLSTLKVLEQPASGAMAIIDAGFNLVVDYSGLDFAGTDQVTIQVCDVSAACSQEVITIEVAGDISIFNALSPNGDDKNEVFIIQYIDLLPETKKNKVTIFNRWGDIVFSVDNYDNLSRVFRGLNKNGDELPTGTYFYKLEFPGGAPTKTGFISLRK